MQVGVVTLGQTAIGALNLLVTGVARNAEDSVGIGRSRAHRGHVPPCVRSRWFDFGVMKEYLVERIDRCHTEHEPMPADVTVHGRSATMSHPEHRIRVPHMKTRPRTRTTSWRDEIA